jgi:hypothetical protein
MAASLLFRLAPNKSYLKILSDDAGDIPLVWDGGVGSYENLPDVRNVEETACQRKKVRSYRQPCSAWEHAGND